MKVECEFTSLKDKTWEDQKLLSLSNIVLHAVCEVYLVTTYTPYDLLKYHGSSHLEMSVSIHYPFEIKRVHLPLYKVADKPFEIHGEDLSAQYLCSNNVAADKLKYLQC